MAGFPQPGNVGGLPVEIQSAIQALRSQSNTLKTGKEAAETRLGTAESRLTALETLEAWHVVGAAGEPAFQNSWVNTGVAGDGSTRFLKQHGIVFVQCWVKSGTTGVAVFNLPAGYRPNARVAIKGTNGVADLLCFVESGGDVIVSSSAVGGDGNCRFVTQFPADA